VRKSVSHAASRSAYAGDYGKPQRDEARERMLEHGFGAVEERSVVGQFERPGLANRNQTPILRQHDRWPR
jgi:hypothetical protein